MTHLLGLGLSNLCMAALLAVVAALAGRWSRRPALAHALWLLVLLKLVTPPLVPFAIGWPEPLAASAPAPAPTLYPPPPVGGGQGGGAPGLPAAPAEQSQPVQDQPTPLPELVILDDDPEPPNGDRRSAIGYRPADSRQPTADSRQPVARPEENSVPPPAALPLAREESPAAAASFPWQKALGWAWLVGSALWLAVACRRLRQFRELLRFARPAPAEVQEESRRLAERLEVRCPEIWLLPGNLAPMLWALGRRRRLLLPADLLERLTAAQRATLIAHELAHLRRGDHWVRWLELIVLALYWWCPLVWWARRELREAEEDCCDAWVLWALPGAGRAYALALVETVDFLCHAPPAAPLLASGLGQVRHLRRRLTMIMRGTTPRALTLASGLVVLAAAVLLLPLLPSWAQPPRDDGPPRKKEEFDKKRFEVKKIEEELHRLKEELEKHHQMVEKRAHELREAMERLKHEEKKEFERPPFPPEGKRGERPPFPPEGKPGERRLIRPEGKPGERPPFQLERPPVGPGFGPPQELERRLAEIEKKLDVMLFAITQLSKEMHHRPGPGRDFQGPPGEPRREFKGPPGEPKRDFKGPPGEPRRDFKGPPGEPRRDFKGPPDRDRKGPPPGDRGPEADEPPGVQAPPRPRQPERVDE